VAGASDGDTPVQRDFGFLAPQPADAEHIRPMMFPVLPDPVLGKATWSDTYLAPRSGGRKHEGQDLMGNKMLKLLACVSGTVVELRHGSGGNSLYLKGDDGWYYCYLHINNDTPGTDDGANDFEDAFATGLKKGDTVTKGQLLAYLGDSGNAEGSGAHLHFEIRMPHTNWYNASAVNAHYSLTAAEPAKQGGGSSPDTVDAVYATTGPFVPFARAEDFARRQALDFLGVTPTAAWVADAARRLDGGAVSADEFILDLIGSDAWAGTVPPTIRLYEAYFLRRPDTSGLRYWVGRVRGGLSLDKISQDFAASREFTDRYGRLGNADFVKLVYQNVFERNPDNAGFLHWTYQLDHGKSRGWVMRQMCESPEYTGKTADEVGVISAYFGLLGHSPSESDLSGWAALTRANRGALAVLVSQLRTSAAYADRIKAL
jgi:murein DD-endopeptidase MepM/ murein hydrolase activator NlpD